MSRGSRRSTAASGRWQNRIVGYDEVDPATLIPNPANWRSHPSAQRRSLAGAIAEVGVVAAVTVNRRTGKVVDGHLRLDLALERGEPTIPVIYVDLSEDEERLVLATLDPLGAMAGADTTKLAALLAALTPADDAVRGMLADLADRNRINRPGLGDPDLAPAAPDPAKLFVRPGDLWILGDHRILCGDATNKDDVERLLAGAAPTLLATDAPFGVALNLAWRDAVPPRRTGAAKGARRAGRQNTSLPGDDRIDWSEAYALVESLTVGYVWHAGVHAAAVAEGLGRIGFEVVYQVVWDKTRFVVGRGWYHWAHEPALVVRKRGVAVPFYGGRDQSTVWRAPSPKMSGSEGVDGAHDHPTQKPVILFETPIRNHLRRGEVVYDPFVGSGTAIIAAERLGRRCYAMDIEPRFVQVAIERFQAFTGRKAVRA